MTVATECSATSSLGVVAAGHPDEVAAGLAMLAEGGNAIDAVVAAAFMGYVVEPAMCGIGGYGRLSAFDAAIAASSSPSITTCARPAAARPDMFEIDEAKGLKYYETPYTKGLQGRARAAGGRGPRRRRRSLLDPAQARAPALGSGAAAGHRRGPGRARGLLVAALEARRERGRHPRRARRWRPCSCPTAACRARPARSSRPSGCPGRSRRRADAASPSGVPPASMKARSPTRSPKPARRAAASSARGDLASYRPRILQRDAAALPRPRLYHLLRSRGLRGPQHPRPFRPQGACGADSLAFRHLMAEALAAAFVDNIAHYGDPDFGPPGPPPRSPSRALGDRRAAMLDLDRALASAGRRDRSRRRATRAIAERRSRPSPGRPSSPARPRWPRPIARATWRRSCTSVSASFGSHGRGAGNRHHPQQRHGQFRPAARPAQLDRARQDADLRRAGAGRARETATRSSPPPAPAATASPRPSCTRSSTGTISACRSPTRSPRRASIARARRPMSTPASIPRCATGSRSSAITSSSQVDDPGLNAFGRVSAVSRSRERRAPRRLRPALARCGGRASGAALASAPARPDLAPIGLEIGLHRKMGL